MANQEHDVAGRSGLSQESILEAALRVLDREGMSGLGMRAVARELNRSPMSLYRHVENKDALLELLRAKLFDVAPEPAVSVGWRPQLEAMLLGMRGLFRAHPGAIGLFDSASFLRRGPLVAVERVLQLLQEAGMGADEAAQMAAALWAHLVGAVLAEQSPVCAWPGEELPPAQRLAWAARLSDPAVGAGPAISAATIRWLSLEHDAVYRQSLGLMLDAIAARFRAD